MKKSAFRESGYEQVGESVVIVISDRDSHSVKTDTVDAGLSGHVLKLPVPKISIKRVANRIWAFATRCFAAIHKEDVLQTVAVEV